MEQLCNNYTVETFVQQSEPSSSPYSLSLQPLLLEVQVNATAEGEELYRSAQNIDDDDEDSINSTKSILTDDPKRCDGLFSRLFPRRIVLPWQLPPPSSRQLSESDDGDDSQLLDDYDTVYTMEYNTLVHNSTNTTATLRAYAPKVFHSLRQSFGISPETFFRVLLDSGPYVSFHTNSKGSATNAFFFFTPDGAFLIKTIKPAEKKSLLSILPRYAEYMTEQQGRSLLSQVCGLYEVTLRDTTASSPPRTYSVIIMNSVFPTEKMVCSWVMECCVFLCS